MKRIVVAMLFVCSAVRAQDGGTPTPTGATCSKAPDHDRALKLESVVDGLIQAAKSGPLEQKESLTTVKTVPTSVRGAIAGLHCDEPALSPKELADAQALEARASKWADDEDARLAAEEKGRAEIVVPLCEATWMRDNARESIKQEKANPGGVVDLEKLHGWGEAVQYAESQIAALTPRYAAFRHHPFRDWHSEGACVAASKAPNP
jgi:hypothetical protein